MPTAHGQDTLGHTPHPGVVTVVLEREHSLDRIDIVALPAASEGTLIADGTPRGRARIAARTPPAATARHRVGRCRCDTGWGPAAEFGSRRLATHAECPGWRQSSAARTRPPVVRLSAAQV
jgi:hypothetical protein